MPNSWKSTKLSFKSLFTRLEARRSMGTPLRGFRMCHCSLLNIDNGGGLLQLTSLQRATNQRLIPLIEPSSVLQGKKKKQTSHSSCGFQLFSSPSFPSSSVCDVSPRRSRCGSARDTLPLAAERDVHTSSALPLEGDFARVAALKWDLLFSRMSF